MAAHLHKQRLIRFFLILSIVVLTIFVYASYSTNTPNYGPTAHSRNMPTSAAAAAALALQHGQHNWNESNDGKLAGGIGIRAAPNDNDDPNVLQNHPINVKANRKAHYASSGVNEGVGIYALKKQHNKQHREPTIDEVAAADTGGSVTGNAGSDDIPDEDRFISNDLVEEQYVQNLDNTLGNINNTNAAVQQPNHDQNAQQQQKEHISADQSPNQLPTNTNNKNTNNNNNNLNKIPDSDVLIPTSNLQKFIENADKILKNMTVINASPSDANNTPAANNAGTVNQAKDKLLDADVPAPKIDQGNNLEDNDVDLNDEALPPSVVMTIKRPNGNGNSGVDLPKAIVQVQNVLNKVKEQPKPKTKTMAPKIVTSEQLVKEVKVSSVKPANTTTSHLPYDPSKGILTEHIYESGHLNDEINIDKVCPKKGEDIKLLILITSAPSHEEARLAIRQTWGHYATRRDVSIAFMLGRTINQTLSEALTKENFMYGDLIRGNFIDSYNNLTLKTVSTLEWVDQHCSNAKFLLKTDDDMFIHVPNLLKFLDSHASQKRVIYGRLAKKWKPIRNKKSKYFVSTDQFAAPIFPPFTTGPAYVMSSDCIHELYVRSLNQVYLKLEDVFTTGIVAQQLGLKRVHVNEFLNRRIAFNPCNIRKTISVHMVKANEQFDLWKKVLDQTTKCK